MSSYCKIVCDVWSVLGRTKPANMWFGNEDEAWFNHVLVKHWVAFLLAYFMLSFMFFCLTCVAGDLRKMSRTIIQKFDNFNKRGEGVTPPTTTLDVAGRAESGSKQ